MLPYVVAALCLLQISSAQLRSPCPSVLTYEPPSDENDRWYAKVTLNSPSTLSGIWLRIELDRTAELLGNWFGESSSEDNRSFLIKKREFQLHPQEPLQVRFFVKYNPLEPVPRVAGIKLNAVQICPDDTPKTTTAQLYISRIKTTTPSPSQNNYNQPDNSYTRPDSRPNYDNNYNRPPNHDNNYNRPDDTYTRPAGPQPTSSVEGNSDDDFFQGDFSPNRQIIPVITSAAVQGACGTIKVPARPLITYGQDTSEGEWPWHAAIYRSKGINLQYICGGSLVTPSHVITAAHCVTKPKTGQPISPDLFTVYLGKYNLYRLGPNVQDKTVKKISTHPQFNSTYFHNDLAILHLDSPIEISDFVRTVCLWEEDVNLNTVVEKLGTVVGWGFDQHGNITENLMQAKMPVVSTETCIFSNPEFFSRFTSQRTFCAGFRNGTSACTGDSGGGMVFPRSSNNGVWQLRGVVSLSAALQNEKIVCDTSNYIVFTDVAKHIDWVRSVIRS